MKQEKDIQNKLDGLGTFEGKHTEIGTFFSTAFVFLDPYLYTYKVANCCKLCPFAIHLNPDSFI